MGTNYYAEWPGVRIGAGYTEALKLHICKMSAGSLSFEGYRLEYRYREARLEAPLISWKQWKVILDDPRLVIFNEYGVVSELGDFISQVEEYSTENRRRQNDWVQMNAYTDKDRDWLDDEGYSFHDGEFF